MSEGPKSRTCHNLEILACVVALAVHYRFTTCQDARRVRLVDGLETNILKQIFYEYHPLSGAK